MFGGRSAALSVKFNKQMDHGYLGQDTVSMNLKKQNIQLTLTHVIGVDSLASQNYSQADLRFKVRKT